MTTWKADVLLEGNWRGASSVLLRGASGPVLIDTGMPNDASRLVAALAKHGLRPGDIRCLINTHFHVYHVSNNYLFPDSLIYATQQSHDWCIGLYSALADGTNWKKLTLDYYPETFNYGNAEDLMDKGRKIALRWWDATRVGSPSQFRWMECHSLPADIEAMLTSGHVPGHASLLVRNGDSTTIVAGDALLTRSDDDHVLTMIPQCRSQYIKDREKILSFQGAVIPGHDRAFQNTPDPPQGVGNKASADGSASRLEEEGVRTEQLKKTPLLRLTQGITSGQSRDDSPAVSRAVVKPEPGERGKTGNAAKSAGHRRRVVHPEHDLCPPGRPEMRGRGGL
ncbi:MAG: MBL fold metallo-hydrolase [Terriglobia bacterium]